MKWKNYSYEREPFGIRITGYEARDGEDKLRIPSHIDGEPVVEIGEGAFSDEGLLLESVEVPSTVKRIGEGAFRMCMNLTSLILHEGLEMIGESALLLTPLSEVDLPDSVSLIEAPWELGSIHFIISDQNPHYFFDGFCLYHTGDGTRELLVALQSEERESYDIPEGTTAIAENAFSGYTWLRRLTIPGTVETIGEAAFESCQNLSQITLSEGIREICANAFSQCIRLSNIHLPSTVEKIGPSALSDTFGWSNQFMGLERVTVDPANRHFMADAECLFELGESGYRYLLKYFGEEGNFRIPDDVSRILPGAFRRAKFYRCEIPAAVCAVAPDAFRECRNLEEIYFKESDTLLYIPRQPLYRKDEVLSLFAPERTEGGYLFDYPAYDALFATYLNLPDQCGMACCRLKYPVLLTDEMAETYRDFLQTNFNGILKGIAEKQDMERLVMLAELGFFTGENIDEGVEIFSRAGRTKFTGFLLDYRKEHRAQEGFDFTF